MYLPGPSDAELLAAGLTREDVAAEPVDIWPDNRAAFELMVSMRTQWRQGMSGPTGLDYGVMFHKMDRMALTPEQFSTLEDEMQIMEHAALIAMREET